MNRSDATNPMDLLITGPTSLTSSLGPYVNELAAELTALGHNVNHVGFASLPYHQDTQRFWKLSEAIDAVDELAATVDPDDYDVVVHHYGNLELEQLLAQRWASSTPGVYHVHTLAPTLLTTHIPAPDLAADVAAIRHDGYVFFGPWAADHIKTGDSHKTIAYHPGTSPPRKGQPSNDVVDATATDRAILSQLGFASPWKDVNLIIEAASQLTLSTRIVIAGPHWDNPDLAGVDLTAATSRPLTFGNAKVSVIPRHLGDIDRHHLITNSDAGLFPYRNHPNHQGSGALSEYLARGVPVAATDSTSMATLIGPAGTTTPPGDAIAMAHAITEVITRPRYTSQAATRARFFTPRAHAVRSASLYARVVGQ